MTTVRPINNGKNIPGKNIKGSDTSQVKYAISKILNIPDTQNWSVVDYEPRTGLYLIDHEKKFSNVKPWNEIHGIVVDVRNRLVVADSYEVCQTAVTNSLIPDQNGMLKITDTSGTENIFNIEKCIFKQMFEGPILRVFRYGGITHVVSAKRFNPEQSKWGNTITFLDAWRVLGGAEIEKKLFDPDTKYSPYVYIFIVNHLDYLSVSRQDICNRLVYLGYKKMWTEEDGPFRYSLTAEDNLYNRSKNDRTIFGGKFPELMLPEMSGIYGDNGEFVHNPPRLNISGANEFLNNGYYEGVDEIFDRRLKSGEAVVISETMPNGKTKFLTVRSEANYWRSEVMRQGDPSLEHRLFILRDAAKKPLFDDKGEKILQNYEEYCKSFPIFPIYSFLDVCDKIEKEGQITLFRMEGTKNPLMTFEERYINILYGFLMSVPLHRQIDIVEYYKNMQSNMDTVVKFLVDVSTQHEDISQINNVEIIHTILEKAKKSVLGAYEFLNVDMRSESFQIKLNSAIYDTIIYHTSGASIYKILRIIRTKEKLCCENQKELESLLSDFSETTVNIKLSQFTGGY